MTAPESKWVAEAMGMVGTCVGAAMFGHVEHEQQSLDALKSHLQRQADLMERMGEALRFYGSACDASESSPCGYEGNLCCKTARAALAAFQESKQ